MLFASFVPSVFAATPLVEGYGFQIFVDSQGGFAFNHGETNKTMIIEVLSGTWNGTECQVSMTDKGGTLYFYSNNISYIQITNVYNLKLILRYDGLTLSVLDEENWTGTIPADTEVYIHWRWEILMPHEENFMLWIGVLGIILLIFGLMLTAYCFRHYPLFTLNQNTEMVWEKEALMVAICAAIIGFGLIVMWLLG